MALSDFALRSFARQLTGAANGLGLLAGSLLGGLLVVVPQLHLAKDALALHLLFERAQSLIDIVVTDVDLQTVSPVVLFRWPVEIVVSPSARAGE